MDSLRTLHVILPAFNEDLALPSLLERLGSFSRTLTIPMVVWVIDDGSTDRTGDIASRGHFGIDTKLITHDENRGLGQALNTGLRSVVEVAGRDDVAVVMDADDTHDVGVITAMLNEIDEGADLVIASRFIRGGDDSTAPGFRRLLSRGASALFAVFLPVEGIKDFTSGYRAYSIDLLSRGLAHWGERLVEERGFACMVELLLKLRYCKPVIAEVPLVLRYDRKQGSSKLRIFSTVVQYVRLAIRDRLSPPPFRTL